MLTIQDWLDAGYKRYGNYQYKSADFLLQKRFDDSEGKKYYIDKKIIENMHKPLFRKKRHYIDLISIAIVCEDGRSLYRISNEFDEKKADDWVKKNVINKLQLAFNKLHLLTF